jgi:hypothetical protein
VFAVRSHGVVPQSGALPPLDEPDPELEPEPLDEPEPDELPELLPESGVELPPVVVSPLLQAAVAAMAAKIKPRRR